MEGKIGRYRLKHMLGRGGMASVYLAHDPNFDRDVAVKVLPREFMHDPQFSVRFLREAKAIASLEHSAIVPVHDFGEDEGQPFIVMRYMPGGTLEDRLAAGPMEIDAATAVVRRIASALQAAHEKEIIHRDLKPGNILFDQYNSAYLADFGIAKVAETSATLTGASVIGTPAYMSPEQAAGKDAVDSRSDLYSLGVILFQMLTGELPFQADTPFGLALAHVQEPVPSMRTAHPETPIWLDTIVRRSMAKSPGERFGTALEMSRALEQRIPSQGAADHTVVEEAVPAAPPATVIERPPPPQQQPSQQPQPVPAPTPAPAPQAAPTPRPQQAPAKPRSRLAFWLLAGGAAIIGLLCIAIAAIAGPRLFNLGSQPTEIAEVAQEPTGTDTSAPSATASPSPSPSPTGTPVPSATRTPFPTITPTPEPLQPLFTANQNLFCREGPGVEYLDVYIVANTRTMPALARWSNDWILLGVDDPAITRTRCCWVDLQGTLNVELESLELINVLPDRLDCPYYP